MIAFFPFAAETFPVIVMLVDEAVVIAWQFVVANKLPTIVQMPLQFIAGEPAPDPPVIVGQEIFKTLPEDDMIAPVVPVVSVPPVIVVHVSVHVPVVVIFMHRLPGEFNPAPITLVAFTVKFPVPECIMQSVPPNRFDCNAFVTTAAELVDSKRIVPPDPPVVIWFVTVKVTPFDNSTPPPAVVVAVAPSAHKREVAAAFVRLFIVVEMFPEITKLFVHTSSAVDGAYKTPFHPQGDVAGLVSFQFPARAALTFAMAYSPFERMNF